MFDTKKVIVRTVHELRELDKDVYKARVGDGSFTRHANPDGSIGGFVEDGSKIGNNVYIHLNAVMNMFAKLRSDCKIGKNAIIWGFAEIGFGTIVGEGSEIHGKIGDSVAVGDNVEINDNSVIGHNVKISDLVEIGYGVKIGHGSKIGAESIIGNHVRIGENVVIGECVRIEEGVTVEDNKIVPAGKISNLKR